MNEAIYKELSNTPCIQELTDWDQTANWLYEQSETTLDEIVKVLPESTKEDFISCGVECIQNTDSNGRNDFYFFGWEKDESDLFYSTEAYDSQPFFKYKDKIYPLQWLMSELKAVYKHLNKGV